MICYPIILECDLPSDAVDAAADKDSAMNSMNSTLSPDLLNAAEKLASVLLQAVPIAAFQRAKARYDADLEVQALIEQYAAARTDLQLRQANGSITQADLNRLRDLQRQVQTNVVVVDFVETQQVAAIYLSGVVQELNELIGMDFAALASPSTC